MKIILNASIVFEDMLTYDQATEALNKATKKLGNVYTFFIKFSETDPTKWMLCGRNIEETAKFLKNPDDYIIIVD